MKKSYKIIAADLDGTLLDGQSMLSAENAAAISELTKRGAVFAIATGRTLSELPESISKNENIRYAIYSNGAAVIDRKENRCIADYCIRGENIKRLFEILSDYSAHLTVRCGGKSYVDRAMHTPEAFEYFKIDKNHVAVTVKYSVRTTLSELIPTIEGVEDVSAYFHTEADRKSCAKRLAECGISAAFVGIHGLEIFDSRAGKGAALSALAEHLGVAGCDTVGVGDSGNDVSLIKEAGLGLAVANATDALKLAADKTVCHHTDHVVKYILENYF